MAPVPGPARASLLAGFAAAVATGLVGWLIGGQVKPGEGWAAWAGAGTVFVAFLIGLAVIRVWSPRPMQQWATAFLGGHMARFVAAVALAAVLLYSLPPSARAVGGLTFGAGYLTVLLAETWAAARHFRRVLGGVHQDRNG